MRESSAVGVTRWLSSAPEVLHSSLLLVIMKKGSTCCLHNKRCGGSSKTRTCTGLELLLHDIKSSKVPKEVSLDHKMDCCQAAFMELHPTTSTETKVWLMFTSMCFCASFGYSWSFRGDLANFHMYFAKLMGNARLRVGRKALFNTLFLRLRRCWVVRSFP